MAESFSATAVVTNAAEAPAGLRIDFRIDKAKDS